MSNVLLIGDSIVDYYIYGNINRKNPESDVPLVTIEKTEIKEGGAANVLRNLQSLGISTDFFTVVGPCCIKNRVVVDGKVILRFDEERKADNTDLRKRLAKKDISTYNIAVISDYDKGAIDRIEDLIFDLNRANCWTIVDPKKENLSRYRDADIIKPNLLEFERYAGPATDENIRNMPKNITISLLL